MKHLKRFPDSCKNQIVINFLKKVNQYDFLQIKPKGKSQVS